jgi:FkbM family methyltransferase
MVPRLRALRRLNRFIVSRLARHVVVVDGHTLYLDPVDSLGIGANGFYEPLETEVVMSMVKPGDTVIDVGANIGYFTLLLARLVGEKGRVIAIEPDPENFALLQKNVAANGYRNVILMRNAVSNAPGTARLYRSLRSGGQHSLAPATADSWVDVETVRLDDVARGAVAFIKIDVEGAEVAALGGMRGIIERSPGLAIMTEYNPLALREFGEEPCEYLALLVEAGFSLRNIDRHAGGVVPTDPAAIAAEYSPESRRYTNLLCVRG